MGIRTLTVTSDRAFIVLLSIFIGCITIASVLASKIIAI